MKKRKIPMQRRKLVGLLIVYTQGENKLSLVGLPIRTQKLFLLFLLVFNSTQLYRTFAVYLMPVAFLGQFKVLLQFLSVLFLDYHLPLICELAK